MKKLASLTPCNLSHLVVQVQVEGASEEERNLEECDKGRQVQYFLLLNLFNTEPIPASENPDSLSMVVFLSIGAAHGGLKDLKSGLVSSIWVQHQWPSCEHIAATRNSSDDLTLENRHTPVIACLFEFCV